jgi:hypothetical protein
MSLLNKVLGVVALAFSAFVLAAALSTDAYSRAALTEASSYEAMTHLIANADCSLCLQDAEPDTRTASLNPLEVP